MVLLIMCTNARANKSRTHNKRGARNTSELLGLRARALGHATAAPGRPTSCQPPSRSCCGKEAPPGQLPIPALRQHACGVASLARALPRRSGRRPAGSPPLAARLELRDCALSAECADALERLPLVALCLLAQLCLWPLLPRPRKAPCQQWRRKLNKPLLKCKAVGF